MLAMVRRAVTTKFIQDHVLTHLVGPMCITCPEEMLATSRGWRCDSCMSEIWSFEWMEHFSHDLLKHYLSTMALPMEFPTYGRNCPGCSERFAIVKAPTAARDGGRYVWAGTRIDVCIPCQWVWLDDGELADL